MKNFLVLILFSLFLFSACTKTNPETSPPIAVYTIGAGGNCTGAVISGKYLADTALTNANTVAITVNVTKIGPYWITTNTVNGISFSQISTFTTTGPQTVVLTGTGTPSAIDTSEFIVKALNGLSDSCTFSLVTVQGTLPHFSLVCFINGNYSVFSDSAFATNSATPGKSGFAGLEISGLDSAMNANSKIDFGVSDTASVGAGYYNDTSFTKVYFTYIDNLDNTWNINSTSQPSFFVEIIQSNNTFIQGTFNGMIKNQQGTDSINVTDGMFTVPIK